MADVVLGFFKSKTLKSHFMKNDLPSSFVTYFKMAIIFRKKKDFTSINSLRHYTNIKTVGELYQKRYCFHSESNVQGFDDVKIS
jgi:hypothetical protein